MTRLRLTIAKRLKEAQDNAAMLTTFNEVDMENIIQMRQDYQEDFQKKYSVKLGFMSFFTKASVVALKNFPSVNAEIDGDHIIYKNYYNISIAIGTDKAVSPLNTYGATKLLMEKLPPSYSLGKSLPEFALTTKSFIFAEISLNFKKSTFFKTGVNKPSSTATATLISTEP